MSNARLSDVERATYYIQGERFLDDFNEGDMVSWKPLDSKRKFGLIQKIFFKDIPGDPSRKVAMAEVATTMLRPFEVNLGTLKLESRRKVKVEDTG